jgi:hypothetical protein
MTGLTIVLGNHRAHSLLQAAGHGQCIKAVELREAMEASPSLRGALLKYVQVFMVQTAHTAVANARATIEERLARWILMAHDRLDGLSLPLTHEFLSLMLGVRRAGVTEALHALEARKLIRPRRGEIAILNRKGIERTAGDATSGIPPPDQLRRAPRRSPAPVIWRCENRLSSGANFRSVGTISYRDCSTMVECHHRQRL